MFIIGEQMKNDIGANEIEKAQARLEQEIRGMVHGYPIEEMAFYISKRNRATAIFMISIAKKESAWGRHAPKLNGKNCYNYWGYRGQGRLMTHDGYTCFKTPEEAVITVSNRFDYLINIEKLNTPKKMIVWKCGWSCAGHSQESVRKWIQDINLYFQKFQ